MFSIFCRRRFSVPPYLSIFVADGVLVKSFSSRKSTPSVCENASQKSFTVSYLISSCGLSSKDAVSASKKLCFHSPEKPDAVLKLLREYGFTDAHILRIVGRWPRVLLAKPDENLLPKLEFFRSIGVPLPVLRRSLSSYPTILRRSLENALIPFYNDLKSLLHSNERVVRLLSLKPAVFGWVSSKGINTDLAMLRERGVPESSIVTLVMCVPYLLFIEKEKLAAYVDRAIAMGFDISKRAFIDAIQVFVILTESTLKHKMEVYRRCGWSEPDIITAFSKFPICMLLSEKKITATMDFLVNVFGCEPAAIAQNPVVLGLSLDKRIRPRCLVARILNDKGVMKNMPSVTTLLITSEDNFSKSYIVKYEKDIPQLLNIYRGKSRPIGMDSSQEVVSK